MARTTLPLLAYLFASASVSVAISPELKQLGIDMVQDAASEVVVLIGAAIMVIFHAGVAVLIYSNTAFSGSEGFWLAAGLMVACFLASWKGREVFVRYEPVTAAVGTATNAEASKATRRGPLAPGWADSSVSNPSRLDKAAGPLIKTGDAPTRAVLFDDSLQRKPAPHIAGGGSGTTGTLVADNSAFRKTPQWQSDSGVWESGARSSRGLWEFLGISAAWRFPWADQATQSEHRALYS